MPADNQDASKTYTIPRKITKLVRERTVQNTLEQIAHSDLMLEHMTAQMKGEHDVKKNGPMKLKIQQLEDGKAANLAFLKFLGAL